MSRTTAGGWPYQPYWCEENTWHVLQALTDASACAVFISNPARQVAMAGHRAADASGFVVWDYHVVALGWRDDAWWVWDHDCTRGMPVPLREWLDVCFGLSPRLPTVYHPVFRLVERADWFARFRTDRTHMLRAGVWSAPPPSWPRLHDSSNLMRWLDASANDLPGRILDLPTLAALSPVR